jgi:hypothetical protein
VWSYQVTGLVTQVIDDKNIRRRFRASNYQSATRVKPFIVTMPLRLDDGWNQVQFNVADFCKRAYGTQYVETQRIQVRMSCIWAIHPFTQIHANCRLRRVYFADRVYAEEELPAEFKLFLPVKASTNTGTADDEGEDLQGDTSATVEEQTQQSKFQKPSTSY